VAPSQQADPHREDTMNQPVEFERAQRQYVSSRGLADAANGDAVERTELRDEVSAKYAAVATDPDATYHFHTGRPIAERCRYDMALADVLPAVAVESFAGVANPFELGRIEPGSRVVDLGCGAGFDSLLAAVMVGDDGHVVGVDMTDEMLRKARSNAAAAGLDHVEFRYGHVESAPVESGWADVVISNGVFNLCPDKVAAFDEVLRILRPGGVVQFADIANGRDVPDEARRHIDLWTG
jgi:arsenite methyltransferase